MDNTEPSTQATVEGQKEPPDWLVELDALYKRYVECERVAVWGGSYEREQGARMALKPIVNEMFDTLLKLLRERASSGPSALTNTANDSSSQNNE